MDLVWDLVGKISYICNSSLINNDEMIVCYMCNDFLIITQLSCQKLFLLIKACDQLCWAMDKSFFQKTINVFHYHKFFLITYSLALNIKYLLSIANIKKK